jgi:hypothetical protein
VVKQCLVRVELAFQARFGRYFTGSSGVRLVGVCVCVWAGAGRYRASCCAGGHQQQAVQHYSTNQVSYDRCTAHSPLERTNQRATCCFVHDFVAWLCRRSNSVIRARTHNQCILSISIPSARMCRVVRVESHSNHRLHDREDDDDSAEEGRSFVCFDTLQHLFDLKSPKLIKPESHANKDASIKRRALVYLGPCHECKCPSVSSSPTKLPNSKPHQFGQRKEIVKKALPHRPNPNSSLSLDFGLTVVWRFKANRTKKRDVELFQLFRSLSLFVDGDAITKVLGLICVSARNESELSAIKLVQTASLIQFARSTFAKVVKVVVRLQIIFGCSAFANPTLLLLLLLLPTLLR